jgi:hypothetical protein
MYFYSPLKPQFYGNFVLIVHLLKFISSKILIWEDIEKMKQNLKEIDKEIEESKGLKEGYNNTITSLKIQIRQNTNIKNNHLRKKKLSTSIVERRCIEKIMRPRIIIYV